MPSKRKPGYLLHKPTGQARVRIAGKDVYLGPYGSPESRERYDEIITEWFARQDDVAACLLTIDDLCLMFLDFAEGYYRRKDGTPTGTVGNVRSALKYIVLIYGPSRVREFGPRKLKAVRQAMIDDGRCRKNINRLIHWIRRVFRWGVENEHVPVNVYTASGQNTRTTCKPFNCRALSTMSGFSFGRRDSSQRRKRYRSTRIIASARNVSVQ